MQAVMEDIEAYGLLREQALPAPHAPPIADPAAQGRARRRKRSHWLRNAILLVLGYFAFSVCTTVQPLPLPLVDARVSAPFPGGAPVLFGLPDRPFTVLVIGVDRRPSQSVSRTDTILLVRIDPRNHEASFLSIPRDAMMSVPVGDGEVLRDRINTAFVYNYSAEDEGAAPRALADTIERNLGIKVDHYVVFDHYNSKDVIDAVGGITVDNPVEFGQADYSEDDVNVAPQLFPQGKIKLDGYEAVAYGRIREGSTDFDRIERQQRVAAGLIDKASSPLSIFRLPSLYSAYRGAVDTDMSLRQSAGVLSMLKRVPDAEIKKKSLGDASVSCNTCEASIQLLDPVKTAEIIEEIYGGGAGERAAALLSEAGVTP
jgi:LCP family protein required for cell wall assembly